MTSRSNIAEKSLCCSREGMYSSCRRVRRKLSHLAAYNPARRPGADHTADQHQPVSDGAESLSCALDALTEVAERILAGMCSVCNTHIMIVSWVYLWPREHTHISWVSILLIYLKNDPLLGAIHKLHHINFTIYIHIFYNFTRTVSTLFSFPFIFQ